MFINRFPGLFFKILLLSHKIICPRCKAELHREQKYNNMKIELYRKLASLFPPSACKKFNLP